MRRTYAITRPSCSKKKKANHHHHDVVSLMMVCNIIIIIICIWCPQLSSSLSWRRQPPTSSCSRLIRNNNERTNCRQCAAFRGGGGGGNVSGSIDNSISTDPTSSSATITIDDDPSSSNHNSNNSDSAEGEQLLQKEEDSIVRWVQEKLDELQVQQEMAWLEDLGALPANQDFGDCANQILQQAEERLQAAVAAPVAATLSNQTVLAAASGNEGDTSAEEKEHSSSSAAALIQRMRDNIQVSVGVQLKQLYQQHLQSLRDHYGQMYEAVLDQEKSRLHDENDDDAFAAACRESAEMVIQRFREAAQSATPALCAPGEVFCNMDLDYVGTLTGLISDMMEGTELREDLVASITMLDDEREESRDSSSRRRRIPKWCKNLAARALMLTVNYLQGWIAWQGIKRAALERERNMPKFPLF